MKEFFDFINKSKDLQYLCKKDKEGIETLFNLCSLNKCADSKSIMNTVLCYWINHLVKSKYKKRNIKELSDK